MNVTHHNEQQCVSGPDFLECIEAGEKCGTDTFYGYNLPEDNSDGTVSTVFKGYGTVQISFRNCGLSGTVSISMNGIVSATGEPGKQMLVGFDRKPGDVLEIKQHGDAIIKIDKITFPRRKH